MAIAANSPARDTELGEILFLFLGAWVPDWAFAASRKRLRSSGVNSGIAGVVDDCQELRVRRPLRVNPAVILEEQDGWST